MRDLRILTSLPFVLVIACTPRAADMATDLRAIDAIRDRHVQAVNRGDAQAVLADMTDDVIYLPPGQSPVLGRTALQSLLAPAYEQFDFAITLTAEDVDVRGDIALEWGMLRGTTTAKAGGQGQPFDGKYLYVYHRQPDGSWKITRDIYNANSP